MLPLVFALLATAFAVETTAPSLVPGGRIPADVTQANVIAAATCAMQLENARSNSLYALQLVDIVSATSQVVSGVRYDMVLRAGYSTTCRNDGSAHTLAECPVASPAEYEASVVVQPWMSEPCSLVSFTAVAAPQDTTPAPAPSDETTQPACGPHSHFSNCGSACPPTCEDPNPQICIMMCVFGCVCDDGYLLHNGACVLPADCPATPAAETTPEAAPTQAAGGSVPVDVTDADVVAAAMCAMQYENARSNSLYTLQLVRIASATSQVVAGIRYNLVLEAAYSTACRNDGNAHTLADCPVTSTARLSYDASVVMQPWLSPACSVVSFNVAPIATTPAPATTASAPLVGQISGGKTAADVTSNGVVSAATCAMQLENARSNSLYALQLVDIVSATSQVVSGVRYDMVLRAGYSTTCRNDGSAHTLAECPVSSPTYYAAAVVVQPWKSPECSLISFAAATPVSPLLGTNPLSGGESPAQANSTLVQRAAVCAVTDLNARSNSVYQTQLVQVLRATQQVVSGVKYRLTFLAAPSIQCLNDGSTPSLARCPVDVDTAQEYQATVVLQPWKAQSCVVTVPAAPVQDTDATAAAAGSVSSGSSSNNNAVVVGAVVGVVGGLVLVAAVALVVLRRRAAALPQEETLEEALITPETN